MKLVVIMSVDACAEALERIYADHHVPVFSEADIRGFHRDSRVPIKENWFGNTRSPVYSKLTFAFLPAGKADELLGAISAFNEENHPDSPIRAFLLNVEKSI